MRFTVRDSGASAEVSSMGLWRHRLTPPIATQADNLASIPTTGVSQTPGHVQLSTTAISDPVVDNTNYAYWLICDMDPNGALGLYGATVEYTVTGAQGAAA